MVEGVVETRPQTHAVPLVSKKDCGFEEVAGRVAVLRVSEP